MRCVRCRRRRQPDRGTALVEFALVLPVFALMLFAMIQFGLLFAGWAQLRDAVQVSARAASLGEPGNSQCGAYGSLFCQVALQLPKSLGSPVGLTLVPTPVGASPTAPIPVPSGAHCTVAAPPQSGTSAPHISCQHSEWLDGYYIYKNGTWQQILDNAALPSTPVDLTGNALFQPGNNLPWTCTEVDSAGNCTALVTNVHGTATDALGSEVGVACQINSDNSQACGLGNTILVCAELPATFTGLLGFLGTVNVTSQSAFYIEETSTASTMQSTGTPVDQGGIPCG